MGTSHASEARLSSEGDSGMSGESMVLTVPEVAAALQVSRWTVYDRIKRHEIPTITVGRALRVPRRWLDELLAGDIEMSTP